VLQVNFRGSGGRGTAFVEAGRQQWGRAMQDDVTDATRWAIAEGIADPARICIAGGSYGGYAALMGVIREPGLYRCAIGTIGVYDLPMMFVRGDIAEGRYGRRYLREWVGPSRALDEVSPYHLAAQVKVPVFLAAGGEDERAPQRHTQKMERALREAGTEVEALYFPTESHGIYAPANRRAYYAGMLRFLARHLGGREPRVEAVTAPAATTGADAAVRQ
jgi:dipeptidyl aminopeptidase/acylaminoacyl peptidase